MPANNAYRGVTACTNPNIQLLITKPAVTPQNCSIQGWITPRKSSSSAIPAIKASINKSVQCLCSNPGPSVSNNNRLILPTDFACICSNAKNINIKGIVPITPLAKAVSVKKILANGFILPIHPNKIARGIANKTNTKS